MDQLVDKPQKSRGRAGSSRLSAAPCNSPVTGSTQIECVTLIFALLFTRCQIVPIYAVGFPLLEPYARILSEGSFGSTPTWHTARRACAANNPRFSEQQRPEATNV
jgi:hypothetical protein